MVLTKRKSASADKNKESLENAESQSNIEGDEFNIIVLLFFYTLQGIPLGLFRAIPMLLQNRGITYTQQAEFSFVNWSVSIKLLWAPLVDSLYWPEFGRRKSWMVPVQYLIGILIMVMSNSVRLLKGRADLKP